MAAADQRGCCDAQPFHKALRVLEKCAASTAIDASAPCYSLKAVSPVTLEPSARSAQRNLGLPRRRGQQLTLLQMWTQQREPPQRLRSYQFALLK